MELIELFETLVKIPSPSLNEDKVANKVIEILSSKGIEAKKDSYGNVFAKVKATDNTKKPILFSSHMDVVGDDSPVHIVLTDNEIIETDKSRTLGADDKAGVTAAIATACKIINNNGRFFVEDLNSSNKTYVNGRQVVSMQEIVRGNRLRMGRLEFLVNFERVHK